MKKISISRFAGDKISRVALIIVILIGACLRLISLTADPPMYFDGHGQSLSTDPYQYTYFARNKILFDEGEMFDSARWRVFEFSMVSGLSYLLFGIFGVSRFAANMAGLILSFLSIIIFLAALKRFLNIRGLLIAAVFLVFNETLHVYGRLPYLENGMLFWLSVLFFVFVYYRHDFRGQVVIGILVALAAMTGKIFGLFILFPLILTVWLEKKPERKRSLAVIVVSCFIPAFLWIIFVHGGSLSSFSEYYGSQAVGLYGLPDALKSPITFFERLISFGSDSRFYFHAPFLGLALFLAVLILFSADFSEKLKSNLPLLFLLLWFAFGQMFFMIPNYRPIRYIYMLYFPLAGIAGYVFGFTEFELKRKKGFLYFILIMFCFWILIAQIVINIFYIDAFEQYYRKIVWYSLPVAIVLALIVWKTTTSKIFQSRNLRTLLILVLVLASVGHFIYSYAKYQKYKSFQIEEAGHDIGEILGKNAVICGPMASTVLPENDVMGMIYAVGVSDTDANLLRKHPVTHFIISAKASGAIIEKYPELSEVNEVSWYWVRDDKTLLVRINDKTANPEAAQYQRSDYETGRDFLERGELDSALFYFERFADSYPRSKSCLKMLGETYFGAGYFEKGLEKFHRAAELYPQDFSIYFLLGGYYHQLSVITGDKKYLSQATRYYEKVLEVNPYQWDEVTAIVEKLSAM